MAQALQCPSCGSTMPLEGREAGDAVQCASCGQVMTVPPGPARRSSSRGSGGPSAVPDLPAPGPTAGAATAAAGATASTGGGGAPSVAPPAPRRRSRPTMTAGGAAAGAAGGTAVLAPDTPRAAPAPAPTGARDGRARVGRADGVRQALPLWLRVVIWVVALPLGLIIVGVPARSAGYLTSQKLLDVIVKHDLGRFVPIVVIVALWALVTALLVTGLVEGGRWWMLRRRDRKASASASAG